MATAFSGALVPPCAVPGDDDEVAGLHRHLLSPSQIVPVPSRMYCISLVLGACAGTMPFCTEIVDRRRKRTLRRVPRHWLAERVRR